MLAGVRQTAAGPQPRPRRGVTVKARVLDRRTKEAAAYRDMVDRLTKHLGGRPSATQSFLIERSAMLSVHMERMDRRAFESGAMSEADQRCYLSWVNTMSRTMRQLGLKGVPPPARTIADVEREFEARKAQQPASAA